MALKLEQGQAATAGVASLAANGGTAQTGALGLNGPAVSFSGSAFTFGSDPGYGYGRVESVMPNCATPFLAGLGDSYTLGTSSTGSCVGATSTTPLLAQSTSGATSTEASGWYSSSGSVAFGGRSQVLAFMFRLPNASDYASGTSLRIGAGFASATGCNGSGGNWTTVIGTDAPTSCSAAYIRYSNNAGDAEYQLVTCNATACNVTAFSSSFTPSTSLTQCVIAYNSGTNVSAACGVVGGTQYTAASTTDLPGAVAMAPIFFNMDAATTATHIQVGSVLGYDPGSSY